MYFKLALRNVKKSYRDYLIYFLTLMFSVCLFYTFNSFQSQQAVMEINESQRNIIQTLALVMNFVSIFVAIVLAFLILYANNFLIKRRKKELGIYTVLGMAKGKISRILVYETFIIGLVSLITGMLIGIIISQVLTAVTANLFLVPLNYSFVFSIEATLMTIGAFSLIFIITMIFNTFVLNRYKLIDLLHAESRSDELKIKKIWISVVLFVISLGCLGWAYYQGLHQGLEAFMNLGPIILAGSIGTLLFFLSLAGFLLTVLKSNKGIYFKNLNCFILRQINSNINMNFLSMSIVCIMLLLSIGALSTGLSLNNSINNTIHNSTPYDTSLEIGYFWPNASESTPQSFDFAETVKKIDVDTSQIKDSRFLNMYDSGVHLDDPAIFDCIEDKQLRALFKDNHDIILTLVPLSSYNEVLKAMGYEPIELNKDQVYIYSTMEYVSDAINKIMKEQPTLNIYGHDVKITNTSYKSISLGTSGSISEYLMAFVVDDSLIPQNATRYRTYWNVNLKDKVSQYEFNSHFSDQFFRYVEKYELDKEFSPFLTMSSRDEVINTSKGMAVVFTYIGIYLGIVFMIASAVILALQQLSQANDNKKRYNILNKIGTDQKMMNRSILLQIAIYFMMPLLLAIIHSIVGIQMVNGLVTMFGRGDILQPAFFTSLIIIVIYGSYFLVTYFGYKNILKS